MSRGPGTDSGHGHVWQRPDGATMRCGGPPVCSMCAEDAEWAEAHLPRAFILQRDVDETGVSGTGLIATGVRFPDGVVALRWCSEWPTSVVFHDRGMEAVEAVHGHGGKTRVVWLTP